MPRSDIIVVGASAGGVEALKILAAGLPRDLQAAVFVVLHIGNGFSGQSYLPEIITRAGPLPAVRPAADGEPFKYGVIYIAPPDYHLCVDSERVSLSHGPKENRTRPAINPLFRSAAKAYGGRVAGVILSGLLDDGVAGLAEIKRRGGLAVVQDPSTAMYPDMPLNAIHYVATDYVVPLEEIASILTTLTTTEHTAMEIEEPVESSLTKLTCPECRGPLWKDRQGKIVEYRCRVGHIYSPSALDTEHQQTVERTLWSGVVALEEAADIAEELATELGPYASAEAKNKREHAAKLKGILGAEPNEVQPKHMPPSTDKT